MRKEDRIKLSLIYCGEKRCEECFYNRWMKEVCQTRLCKDTLKLISNLEQPKNVEFEQVRIDI